jgi:hypothetical protein
MKYSKLFVIAIISSLFYSYSYTAERNPTTEFIPITNGLLTYIPLKFVVYEKKDDTQYASHIKEKAFMGSLINFMSKKYIYNDTLKGKIVKTQQVMFYPTIILFDTTLCDFNSFSKKRHKEAKEACRQNLAVFYPYRQGAIIYSFGKIDLEFLNNKKQEIEMIIDKNFEKAQQNIPGTNEVSTITDYP